MSDESEVPDEYLPFSEQIKRRIFGAPKPKHRYADQSHPAQEAPVRRLGSMRQAMLGNIPTEAKLREEQMKLFNDIEREHRGQKRIYPLQGLEREPVYASVEQEIDFKAAFAAAFPYLIMLTLLAWVLGLIGYWAMLMVL